jgi:thioredoxin reductase
MDILRAEVGIVGAGFAGLAAALTLRRQRRSALVFDGGPARNAWAKEIHGYLGVQGLSGVEMRRLACEQALAVGAQIVAARIVRARKDDAAFDLESEDGRHWQVERVLIATGVRDVYPEIDNFFDFFGQTVHTCPHCDGYEVRDQPIAIVSWSEAALPFALKLGEWSRQITVVTDGHEPALGPEEQARLAAHNIGLVTRTVKRFEGTDGQLEALRFDDDSTLPVRAAFFNIKTEFSSDIALQLGCALREPGCIRIDDHGRTSVDGVWAAGDVVGEEQLVAIAAGLGVRAGMDIYRSLS